MCIYAQEKCLITEFMHMSSFAAKYYRGLVYCECIYAFFFIFQTVRKYVSFQQIWQNIIIHFILSWVVCIFRWVDMHNIQTNFHFPPIYYIVSALSLLHDTHFFHICYILWEFSFFTLFFSTVENVAANLIKIKQLHNKVLKINHQFIDSNHKMCGNKSVCLGWWQCI